MNVSVSVSASVNENGVANGSLMYFVVSLLIQLHLFQYCP